MEPRLSPSHGEGSGATPSPVYSFVVPVLDEVESLPELERRLVGVMSELDGPSEVIFVDDGSTDGSFDLMTDMHERDSRFKIIRLSRNFGHQIALTAGLDHSRGEATIILDADLQDPPEVALEMAAKWREGHEVVHAVRRSRRGESVAKLITARQFYRVLGRMSEVEIPRDAGDFRLVDRRALDAVRSMGEHRRYLRGLFAWVGYRQTTVDYSRDARYAGTSKFSFRKMVTFATDGIISFTAVPLRLILNLGFIIAALSFGLGLGSVVLWFVDVYTVPGWASLATAITFLGGLQLAMLGVIGEYIARIHDEVKGRPLYLLERRVGAASPLAPTDPNVEPDRRGAPDG